MTGLYIAAGCVVVVVVAMMMIRSSAKSEGSDEARRETMELASKRHQAAADARSRRRARGRELVDRMRKRSGPGSP